MKFGNKKYFSLLFFSIFFNLELFAEDKILSSPLINLNELKPSFEEDNDTQTDKVTNEIIFNKKNNTPKNNSLSARFIGLDKITAKTLEIDINIGETKNFGPLEIKVLKCAKTKQDNSNSVAYIQVKDLSENENEKVFIFNGWTFSSDPTVAPFDHAIYDLQLVNCNNV